MAAMNSVPHQLVLPVQLPDAARLATWEVGPNTELAGHLKGLNRVRGEREPALTYLWGGEGRGKTHLLCALCDDFASRGHRSIYLPLRDSGQLQDSRILQGLEQYDLVALDDLDQVTRSRSWCEALFALLNQVQDNGQSRVVVSSYTAPAHLPVLLPDLHSRLQQATAFHLKELRDEHKVRALQLHAEARGLVLEPEVAEYILHRLSRDMNKLMAVLEQLDQASMRAKRRLTVPFVRQALTL